MRKLQKPPAEELRKRKKEPLAEGLQITVPTDSIGRRMWSKLSDEQVVEFARTLLKEREITKRNDLKVADSGLYEILRKRGLLSGIEFDGKPRLWGYMSDGEIVEFAQKIVKENEIVWRKDLKKYDSGLHEILRQRRLLGDVGFKKKVRSWKDMSDEEIVEFAKKIIEENEITKRCMLEQTDDGLYQVLRKRRLLDEFEFEEKRWRERPWKDMSDEEIVEFAKKIMEKEGIVHKDELSELDRGIYAILYRKRLLGEVGFVEKQRSWKGMSDEEIVEFARNLIKEKDITLRGELRGADYGLYDILKKRGLIDRAFAQLDQQKDKQARDAVIDALEAFAANDNAASEEDVA